VYKAFLDFSGGVNDTFSDLRLAQNEGPTFRNVNLDRDGAVSKRKGSQKLIVTQIGAGDEAGGMIYFQPTGGTAELVGVFGDAIVRFTGAWDTLYTGLTNNKIALLVPFKNLLYINNGVDDPLVYVPFASPDPKVWRPGQPTPAGVGFNSDIAGAMTTGDILVRIRFVGPVDDSFVGEPAPETGQLMTVSASGGIRVNLDVYIGTDHRVEKRLIERTKVGGGAFYIDGYVNDNVTTTYDIVQPDSALEGNFQAPDLGSRGIPPKLFPFCLSGNRIVGWNAATRRVEWSNIDEFGLLPEAFHEDAYQYLDITDGEDEPVACVRFADQVVFYCGRSVHRVFIDDGGQSSSFRLDNWEVGIPSPRSAIEVPGGHIVWTYKGPYFFDGNVLDPIGGRIEELAASLEKPSLNQLYAVHRYDRRQIKFVLPTQGSSHLNMAAVYHYHLERGSGHVGGAWTTHDGFEAKSGCMGRDASTKVDREFSGDYNGYVRIEDVGDVEDFVGTGKIEGSFTTRWLDMDDPFFVKEFRHIWVIIEAGNAGNITLQWESEFGDGDSGLAILTAATAASLFDSAIFDVSTFAGGQNKVVHTWLAQDGRPLIGRHVRFTLSNTNANEPFTILGFLVEYERVRDRSDSA
jgi:hypothetical protein